MKQNRNFLINDERPFFLLRRKNEAGVWLCTGDVTKVYHLDDIPQRSGVPGKETFDSVSLIPFAQARERGLPVHDGREPIVSLVVKDAQYYDLEEVLAALPNQPVKIEDLKFDTTASEYAETIRQIIENEIGSGQGANFVIARRCDATLPGLSSDTILSIFRSLLVNEFGTYWTFLFSDGESYVMGVSPERHISARGGEVMMNPISGTFRKSADSSPTEIQTRFLEFLKDEKEIFELFMVTDEELKIMCDLCEQGGSIVGPMLKEMSKLIHTEYLLIGKSSKSVIELLRQSMFAPTVTGSPVLSAFRVIQRYEQESRGYYGATIALIGRDAEGGATLDAPITIRTVEIDRGGHLVARVGATLVRGSDPASEVKETETKIAGMIGAIAAAGNSSPAPKRVLDTLDTEAVQILLQKRNLYLSRFWFEPQSVNYCQVPELKGKTITVVDAEDGFSSMLKRMIGQMGAQVKVVNFSDYSENDVADLTILGPGPGNPSSLTDPKMIRMRDIMTKLRARRSPLFAVCLSHQILCDALGFSVVKKHVPFQGAQEVIDFFGKPERVGFYNTFVGIDDKSIAGVEVAADPDTKEINAIRGEGFFGVQFHLESILTPRGYDLTREVLISLLSAEPGSLARG